MTTQNGKDVYKTRLRDNQFAQRLRTQIWYETPTAENPYISGHSYLHGYDLFELLEKRSFVDVFYLLFQGELPNAAQAGLLQTLMVGLINPGTRHPATRAAINTGIGKTDTAHILPISLLAMGGKYLGGNEVPDAMRFLNKHYRRDPRDAVSALLEGSSPPQEGDWHVTPGFGTRFGGIDAIPAKLAKALSRIGGETPVLDWGNRFAALLEDQAGCGWLTTGVAAAAFSDLGIHPRAGAGLFQLVCAPGLLAHGLEMSNKPITAMPFIDDDHYVIEK